MSGKKVVVDDDIVTYHIIVKNGIKHYAPQYIATGSITSKVDISDSDI